MFIKIDIICDVSSRFLCDVKSYFSCCQGWSGEFSIDMDGGNLISVAVGKRVFIECDDLED